MHPTVEIQNTEKKTPETVSYYNKTKHGVDVVDQMTRLYTTKAGTRRWPMQVFYNILDIAGINAWVLYKLCTGKKISRRNFLKGLCEELRQSYISSRTADVPNAVPNETAKKNLRVRCKVQKSCGNKTTDVCVVCKKPVCGKCTSIQNVWCKVCHNV